MRIVHVITDLDTGGAEIMLYKLLYSMRYDKPCKFLVVSLMGEGRITNMIKELGIRVETLNLNQGERPGYKNLRNLKNFIKTFNPDIVQGWMYHGNIAATISILFFSRKHKKIKLFWNIRQTLYDISNEKRQTRWLIILSRWLSFLPYSIIYNSTLSMEQHTAMGFSDKKINMIPNGFDLQKFRPDQNHRQQLREELEVSEDTILIGHISRFHPMKDHATFFRAIDRVTENIYNSGNKQEVLFLLAGHKVEDKLSSNASIRFLGQRDDIPRVMSALDILVSSSAWGEGFPNVVGEAMASEVPCVVTDVGDSANIVGKYGKVCTVSNDHCIADSLLQLIRNKEERKILGKQARKRIKEKYSMGKIKKEYLKEWGFE